MVASSMERRTCCPRPLRSRAKSAELMAWAAVTPVSLSGTMSRSIRGRPLSRSAWIDASPDSACTSGS